MIKIRPIDISDYPTVSRRKSIGHAPRLDWIPIKCLVIDPTYQRDIGRRGRASVMRIASEFDWAKFAPVVVAPADGDRFAIVDGQHRTTAAALIGLDKVPCAIIDAARAQQAAAFAAINANVTAVSALQLHAARAAAGDDKAVALDAVCARAGVSICRYPIPANKMKPGQTLAPGRLYSLLDRYGDVTLVAALKCITRTRDGYPGGLRRELIDALCAVIEAEPDWAADEKKMLKAAWKIDFRDAWRSAMAKSEGNNRAAVHELVESIADAFDKHFESRAA